MRRLVGVDDLDDRVILGSSAWTVNHMAAEHYGSGRVFCGGDAVHRHPPSNGLGSNTSIQDSFNLAWKLALVLRGDAGPALLDTYTAERAPIGRQVVDRANRSIAETGRIFDALGVERDPTTRRRCARTWTPGRATGPRSSAGQLREAVRFKAYEFDAHGVELNHRYVSSLSFLTDRHAGLHSRPQLTPSPRLAGRQLPHAWVTHTGPPRLALDLAGHGAVSAWTGIGGKAWLDAAAAFAARTGLPITGVWIGPREPIEDPSGPGPSCARSPTAASCGPARSVCRVARHASAPDSAETAAAWLHAAPSPPCWDRPCGPLSRPGGAAGSAAWLSRPARGPLPARRWGPGRRTARSSRAAELGTQVRRD